MDGRINDEFVIPQQLLDEILVRQLRDVGHDNIQLTVVQGREQRIGICDGDSQRDFRRFL